MLPSQSPGLFRAVGAFFGRMDLALQGFSHAGLQRENEWDLAAAPAVLAALLPCVDDDLLR